jgi:branched-chain amino acid aminotransferase
MAVENISQKDGWIWMNGQFVEWKEAKVHILTHSLHYASSVFEGERCYNGKVFKNTEHHKRLLNSCRVMDIDLKYSVEELNKIVDDTLKKNNLTNAYIRPLVWNGAEGLGIITYNKNKPNLMVATWEWPSIFGSNEDQGIKLIWANYAKPDPKTEPVEAKAAGLYMIGMIEENRAVRAGRDDALFRDYRGYVAECGSSNVFFVFNGELHTPTTRSSLNGITRQTIIELAKEKGIKLYVRDIAPEELEVAEEVFVTGTAAEVMPVVQVGDLNFKVGKITKDLRNSYLKLAGAR